MRIPAFGQAAFSKPDKDLGGFLKAEIPVENRQVFQYFIHLIESATSGDIG